MSRGRLEVASAVESPLGTPLPPGVRQKGGWYEGRLKVSGKEYRVTGETPDEAFARLRELHLHLAGACGRAFDAAGGASEQRAPASPGHLLTLAELLGEWMTAHPEWKPRTRAEYEELAARWLLPSLGLLSPRDIEGLLRSMPTRQADKVYTMLRAAFRTAYRWGLTGENTAPLGELGTRTQPALREAQWAVHPRAVGGDGAEDQLRGAQADAASSRTRGPRAAVRAGVRGGTLMARSQRDSGLLIDRRRRDNSMLHCAQ